MFQKFAAATALLLASAAGFAAEPNPFYAGVDVGSTKITDVPGHDTSYGVFAGYRLLPNLAVELGQRRLFEQDYQWGAVRAESRVDQTALSLLGSLPVGPRLDVFGRLGAAQGLRGGHTGHRVGRAARVAAVGHHHHEAQQGGRGGRHRGQAVQGGPELVATSHRQLPQNVRRLLCMSCRAPRVVSRVSCVCG